MQAVSGPIALGMVGRHGRVVDLDRAYAALLGTEREAVIGQPAITFIHPDDRPAAATFLETAWRGDAMMRGTQRHLHADGRPIWVDLQLSRLGEGDGACLVVSCIPLCQADGPSTVQAHWQMARLLIQALEGGKRAFGDSLIGNPATEILLLTYVAEAEARAIEAGEIARRINVTWSLTRRWLLALAEAGFAEAEAPGPLTPQTPVRLSPRALAMIEAIFAALVAVVQDSRVAA
ncbi:MAG: PAS domain-containing protein [Sphingomonas taxi]